jgi:uncharacterized protein (DUF2267 family)
MAELTFIKKVAEHAQIPEDQAAALTEATLRVLARRISEGQALELASRMSDPLRPFLVRSGENAEVFSFDEFIGRIARQADVPREVARRGAGGVLHAMRADVGYKEFEDLRAQLPGEFAQLLPTVGRRR